MLSVLCIDLLQTEPIMERMKASIAFAARSRPDVRGGSRRCRHERDHRVQAEWKARKF
jgi:hypothetical protein